MHTHSYTNSHSNIHTQKHSNTNSTHTHTVTHIVNTQTCHTQSHLLFWIARMAWIGLKNIIPTIMMGKMEMELPAIHMMNMFIGTCLMGPRAMSHDLCNRQHVLGNEHVHRNLPDGSNGNVPWSMQQHMPDNMFIGTCLMGPRQGKCRMISVTDSTC